MEPSTADLDQLYYRKSIRQNSAPLSVDADMIRLLVAIDPDSSILRITRQINMPATDVRGALSRLLDLKLIEPIVKQPRYLAGSFVRALRLSLTKAVGPMALILIEDVLEDLGLSLDTIPEYLAAELVDRLAREIPEQSGRLQFQASMLKRLQAQEKP